MAYVYGIIHSFDEQNRLIGIKNKKEIDYYYITSSQLSRFGRYLNSGVVLYCYASNNKTLRRKHHVTEIISFIKLLNRRGKKLYTYFDYDMIKEGVVKVIKKPSYKLFLDFEFSMPPYNHKHGAKDFYMEIISYGLYLLDDQGNSVDTDYGYLKPTCQTGLSDRTIDFLNIKKEVLTKAPPFYKFYNLLKEYMVLYQPTIYIWGRNDYLMLDSSYKRYKLEPITNRKNFVNLMQLIKTYYNIKDDIGLYAAYEIFNKKPPMEVQDHNALHDAACTVDIYRLFLKLTNNLK